MSKKKAIITKHAPGAIGPYSQGICVGDYVFTSGQLPIDPNTGEMPNTIEEQTKVALSNVSAVLCAGGSTMSKVIKLTVFLKNMDDFSKMNEVYATFFEDVCPARSTVEVARLPKDALIEIEAIGVKYEGRL